MGLFDSLTSRFQYKDANTELEIPVEKSVDFLFNWENTTSDYKAKCFTDKNREYYRYLFINGVAPGWHAPEMTMTMGVYPSGLAKTIVSTYITYMFKDLELDDQVMNYNVMNNLLTETLLYRKIKVYFIDDKIEYFYNHQIENDTVYKKMDGKTYELIEIDNNYYWKHEKTNILVGKKSAEPVVMEIKTDSLDIINIAMVQLHRYEKAVSLMDYDMKQNITFLNLSESELAYLRQRGSKGKRTFRWVMNSTETEKINKNEIINGNFQADQFNNWINEIIKTLSNITNINLNRDSYQTKFEFEGREQPFIQLVNALQDELFESLKAIYQTLADIKNWSVDELMIKRFTFTNEEKQLQNVLTGYNAGLIDQETATSEYYRLLGLEYDDGTVERINGSFETED